MPLLRKIIGANAYRRSRLHDENGTFVGWRALRHLPRNLVYVAGIRLCGHYPELPWWTFDAVAEIERLLRSDWRVVEFGSGMSTLWLARRVGHLLSIEDNPDWHARVADGLRRRGLDNVTHVFRQGEAYADLSDVADGSIDFAVIDGSIRWKCIDAVLAKMKPGGYIYLDNSDADKDRRDYPDSSSRKLAQARMTAIAAARGATPRRFNALTIGLLSSHEGMLVQV